MELHENKDLFTAALQLASSSVEEGGLGIKQIFVEKDYWICRSLKLLAESDLADLAVFKGGTSLSKAYHLGNRFSEDLDIAITNDPSRSDNQTKSIISRISRIMSSGLEELVTASTRKYSKYRKVFYRYSPSDDKAPTSAINAGQILLEIVSFANPYPYRKCKIKSFVCEYLENSGRMDIIDEYGLGGFEINILAESRTATEKVVSLMRHSLADSYQHELKSKIRHFYDLYYLWNESNCRAYMENDEFMVEFNSLWESDRSRFDEPSGWRERELSDSPLIKDFDTLWDSLKIIYNKELPELAYDTIPKDEDIKKSIVELLRIFNR